VPSAEASHDGIAAFEVQAVRIPNPHRATPILALRADNAERSIRNATTRPNQFKRLGKCPTAVVATPTQVTEIRFSWYLISIYRQSRGQ